MRAFQKAFAATAASIATAFAEVKAKAEVQAISFQIPEKLKDNSGNIDLNKFNQKKPGNGPPTWIGPLGWYIQKDIARHGESVWKLFNWAGKRIASLAVDGKILRQ